MVAVVTPIVELRGCAFAHEDGGEVFSGIDFAVRGGDRVALLGANGSGKTTLLRLLAGALRPDSGTLDLDGRRVRHSRADLNELRRSVQLVLQDPDDQIFATSVFADVSFGPMNQDLPDGEVEERVEEALEAAEITDLAERIPHQLSFGQRKRVALAGALAMRPRVLLLDEPSAGLDPAGVEQLLRTLDTLSAAGTAVAMATHDVDLAYGWADDVAVLHDGSLRRGPTAEVLADDGFVAAARLSTPWAVMAGRALGLPVRWKSDIAGI